VFAVAKAAISTPSTVPASDKFPDLSTLNTLAKVKSSPIGVVELEASAYHIKCVPDIDNAA
jgi:hypothetical protein